MNKRPIEIIRQSAFRKPFIFKGVIRTYSFLLLIALPLIIGFLYGLNHDLSDLILSIINKVL